MPLHDWTDLPDWETVHAYWITELGRWLRPRLPPGYRASLGTVPALVVAPTPVHPDVSVRRHSEPLVAVPSQVRLEVAPDEEVALATLDPARAVYITRAGNLVSVIELISPRNKDRPETRRATTDRLLGYLTHGIHLLFVDVHPRPEGFSFEEDLTSALGREQLVCPAPCTVSHRVGGPAPEGGLYLASWRRRLSVGESLPQ